MQWVGIGLTQTDRHVGDPYSQQQVTGLIYYHEFNLCPVWAQLHNNSGQVVCIFVPLSQVSIIWY